MIYINKSGANIQNKVNGTDYQLLDNKVATIYIPDKFKEKKKSIENTVVAEQFTGTKYTKENLAVQIIPNEKKIFILMRMETSMMKIKKPHLWQM